MDALLRRGRFYEFFRYGVVGAVTTALHYGIYWVLYRHINVNVAYSVGYITAFVLNFYLTCHFTFRVKPSWKRFAGMCSAHALNYLLQILFLNFFLWLGIAKGLAPVPVYAVAIPVNFFLLRLIFKYRKKKRTDVEKK